MKRVEEVEVERGGKKLEVLNFLEMWCFFSLFFIMMICMTSPLEHFFFSTLSACKYVSTERAVKAGHRGYSRVGMLASDFYLPAQIKLSVVFSEDSNPF